MSTESQSNTMSAYRKYYALYGFALMIGLIALTLIYTLFIYLYNQTTSIVMKESKSGLLTLVKTQASRFSYEDINRVSSTSDIGSPSYVRLVQSLHDIKESASPKIAFAYILKYDKNAEYPYSQIADADSIDPYVNIDNNPNNDIDVNKDGVIEPYGVDELTYPGVPYADAPVEELDKAHEIPYANKTLYTDKWGTFMSAYVPIKNLDGTLAGILALDMTYNNLEQLEGEVFKPFLLTVVVLSLLIVLLVLSLIFIWQKKLKQVLEFDRQKNIVIGMIGHELKTPLASIRWILSSVLDIKDISPDVFKKVTQAHGVCVGAAEMSNTILDMSRIQLGKLDLVKEKCDLFDLVDSVQMEMIPIAESKDVTVTFSEREKQPSSQPGSTEVSQTEPGSPRHTYIYASPQYMKIAIKNIISNAIKYTPPGGKVVVTVTVPVQGNILFTVTDTGLGIAQEDQNNLFKKFSRAKATLFIEGHGLGLYLTNNIVLLHGGSLHFTSIVNKGTEFIMEIPQYDSSYENTTA